MNEKAILCSNDPYLIELDPHGKGGRCGRCLNGEVFVDEVGAVGVVGVDAADAGI